MGLRGTTDSILDLGALGMVEVKGIVIDVFAPVAGLQGLKQVDFIASLSATFDLDTAAVILNAFVDIHNPSNLTLNIGDLHLTAVSDYVSATKAGYALIKSLTLVPGDNRLVATSAVSFNDPAGGDLAIAILSSTDPIPFLMIALDDATSNVALNAGLNQLQTSVLLPPGLLEKAPANPPYSTTDMALKFLPTTVDDGLVQMTMKFLNPFIGSGYSFLHMINPHDSDADPRGVIKGSSKVFELLDDLTFSLSGNNTATVTFNIKLHADPTLDRSFYQSLVTESASGNVQLIMNFNPVITLGQDPTEYAPFWTSQIIASGTGGVIPFKAGSDFGLILDWYDKQFPAIVAVPTVATPSPTSTTDVAMPTSLAASPSPVATSTTDPAPPAITVV
ncbi:hypothetical protein BGZ99_006663 [Dissophora globulifera]|uniref:Uncharacterized protein n=1 Tax=Dissophora globulifera TaxID=979702 RepID=A0A9P6US29_9FUNG|nr:hypothetical protein BGZ99_006663 [Dissophora globulifera]